MPTLKRGEEVLRSQPFSYIVDYDRRDSICDFCLKEAKPPTKFKNCSGCKCVYYCSSECQRNAWNSHHKRECAYLKQAPPIVLKSEALFLLVRIILKLQKGGGNREFVELPGQKKRYFSDLVSHKKDIQNHVENIQIFKGRIKDIEREF